MVGNAVFVRGEGVNTGGVGAKIGVNKWGISVLGYRKIS